MKRLIILAIMVFSTASYAQRTCSTNEYLEIQQSQDHFLQEKMTQIEEHTKKYIESNSKTNATVYTIPVVVHVVYNRRSASQNISLAQINSQIAVLNEDFRRTNSDANNTWAAASDVEIEFCLASVDPSGNSTSGVIRKKTNKNSFSYTNDGVKFNSQGGSNAWSSSDYLNIWVCNLSSGLLGYAQFPGGSSSTDGVVIDYAYFGTTGTATFPFNLGRTATHEVGHWLNLRHIWGDGPCGQDDFVSDTPESDASNYGCPSGHMSCTTTDMIENYMDYTDDACMNLFTAGQKTRMRALFSSGGFRASLLNSTGCGGTPPAPTCSDGIMNGQETGVDCGGPDCSPCSTAGCSDPTGLSSTPKKGGREAELSWNAVAGANNYTLNIKPSSSSTWTGTATASGTSIRATSLTKNVSYTWQVKANCTGGSSNFVTHVFTAGQSARYTELVNLDVYPNPANDLLTVEFPFEVGSTILIFDTYGRLVTSKQIDQSIKTSSIDISNFDEGVYILNVVNENENSTKKFSVVH